MIPHFWRFHKTLKVSMSLFKNNRKRLIKRILEKNPDLTDTFIVLQGGRNIPFNDTDIPILFKQVRIPCYTLFCQFFVDENASYFKKIFRKTFQRLILYIYIYKSYIGNIGITLRFFRGKMTYKFLCRKRSCSYS